MKTTCLVLAAMLLANPSSSQEKLDFASHPFFKHLIGQWKAEGALKNAQGEEIKVIEEWKGSASPEQTFILEGWRKINEERQEFRWTITHNTATGLYEASHVVKGNEGEAQRFEVSISEVDLTMELKAPLGSGSGSVTLKDSFADDRHDSIRSDVTLTGDSGEVTLSGEIRHERVKEPAADR